MGLFDFFKRKKKASEETEETIEKLGEQIQLNKKKRKIETKLETYK